MVMVSQKHNVVIDTSALYTIVEKKANLDDIINEMGNVKFCITRSVLQELDANANKSIKKRKFLNIIRNIIVDFVIIEDKLRSADESFIDLAKKDKDLVFVTNDTELIKKLKKENVEIFRLNNGNKFVLV